MSGQAERTAILGISYGAAVALSVAETRDDIDAVVLECPFANFERAVRSHSRLMELPLVTFTPVTLRIAEWMSGARFDSIQPGRAISNYPGRLMIILAESDPFISPTEVEGLKQAAARREKNLAPATIWQVPGTSHLMALTADAQEYARRLNEFMSGV